FLVTAIVVTFENAQGIRVEVLAGLALRFQQGDGAREICIGGIPGIPTSALGAELLGAAVGHSVVDRPAGLALEVGAPRGAHGRGEERVPVDAARRPESGALAESGLAAIGRRVQVHAVEAVGPLPAGAGHVLAVDASG